MMSTNPQKFPNAPDADSPGRRTNVNGIVGIVFSGLSLSGWILMSCLIVSYEPMDAKSYSGGENLRGREVVHSQADAVVYNAGALMANSFLTFIGGAVSGAFLLVGAIVSGIGLAHPVKTPSIIGLALGLAALTCGLLFVSWRWTLWFT